MRLLQCVSCVVVLVLALDARAAEKPQTQNILFVMSDGLRWQEVFTGADERLMIKANGVDKDSPLLAKYLGETPDARREALMPFVWREIAKHGQLYGNQCKASIAHVTNMFNFSYPGYSEILCGYADPAVRSNDKIPNTNVTVLEWLQQKPRYRGRVAAFAAWDVFPSIFNSGRCGFPVVAGYEPMNVGKMTREMALLNRVRAESPHYWDEEPFDVVPFQSALHYLKDKKPRVLFVGLGETDDWAHEGRYDQYLEAAHRADAYIQELWETMQSMRQYRGKTTLIIAPDHGRGNAPEDWKAHGASHPGSENTWYGFLGPDTPALGERSNIAPVTQNQIAATLAALLGEDYNSAVPQAGAPIAEAVKR